MDKSITRIPLKALLSSENNMYELTNAAIHRAKQITMAGPEDLESAGGKIVSLAIREIVTEEVQYRIKQE